MQLYAPWKRLPDRSATPGTSPEPMAMLLRLMEHLMHQRRVPSEARQASHGPSWTLLSILQQAVSEEVGQEV